MTEALGRDGDGSRRILGTRDVELQNEQMFGPAERAGHRLGSAAGRNDRVACRESRLRDVDAHATARPGYEPYALVGHGTLGRLFGRDCPASREIKQERRPT